MNPFDEHQLALTRRELLGLSSYGIGTAALAGLLGNMAALSSFYRSEWLAACPRQEHAPIYQRLFGFRPLAEPRKYFGVDFETQLLGIRREKLREHVRFVKPMMAAWDAALAESRS